MVVVLALTWSLRFSSAGALRRGAALFRPHLWRAVRVSRSSCEVGVRRGQRAREGWLRSQGSARRRLVALARARARAPGAMETHAAAPTPGEEAFEIYRGHWARPRAREAEKRVKEACRQARALGAGAYHALALRADGLAAECWGDAAHGAAPGEGVRDGPYAAVSAGASFSLALCRDGSVQCLGSNSSGQAPPAGLPGPFEAVSAGAMHALGLRRDGTVQCWGSDSHGQAPPEGRVGNFTMVSAGARHSLGLRKDGHIECWGWNVYGQAPPDGVEGPFVVIAAGSHSSYGLRRNGSLVCWGRNAKGQAPSAGRPGPYTTVSAGGEHAIALRKDGRIECWGSNMGGQAPSDLRGEENDFIACECGLHFSMGLRRDGRVECWGRNEYDQAPPAGKAGPFGVLPNE